MKEKGTCITPLSHIPIPSISLRCAARALALFLELGRLNERSNQEFSVGAAYQEISDGRERTRLPCQRAAQEAAGKSAASMPYLVLNDRAHLAATSEGNIPNQGTFLLSDFAPGHPP